jgi:hypothetical protein
VSHYAAYRMYNGHIMSKALHKICREIQKLKCKWIAKTINKQITKQLVTFFRVCENKNKVNQIDCIRSLGQRVKKFLKTKQKVGMVCSNTFVLEHHFCYILTEC